MPLQVSFIIMKSHYLNLLSELKKRGLERKGYLCITDMASVLLFALQNKDIIHVFYTLVQSAVS